MLALIALCAAACGAMDDGPPGLQVVGPSTDSIPPNPKNPDGSPASSSGASGQPAAEPCARAFAAADPATLSACGEGRGHCYDKDKTPKVGTLPECNATQWCVPDAVIRAAGSPLQSCDTGFSGASATGACVSTLVAEIEAEKARLVTDTCEAGSLCVPCVYNGQANPACSAIGVYDKACDDVEASDGGSEPIAPPLDAGPIELASCCLYSFSQYGGQDYTAGQCVPDGALTEEQRNVGFPRNTCNDGFTCAPNELVAGQNLGGCYWDEGWFGDDGFGVCVDRCFIPADKHEDLDYIYEGGCGGTEFCVPCRELPAGTPGCGG